MKLHNGDNLEVLKEYQEDYFDSVVTDPPYGLRFMGNKWDYEVPSVDTWKEVLRVLKPGGHLLSFGGTRTYHRMVVNIEDAGFEIRDMIGWMYGSGFPKSHNISKAIDKAAGKSGEIVGKKKLWGHNAGSSAGSFSKNNYEGQTGIQREIDIVSPATDEAKRWEGWGTALKPALEPIVVARKPFSGTVANNMIEYGTGGINIEECRVPVNGEEVQINTWDDNAHPFGGGAGNPYTGRKETKGRWPANIIHDGSDEVISLFPESNGQQGDLIGNEGKKNNEIYGQFNKTNEFSKRGDVGSAARFFYCAKASSSDRNEDGKVDNDHPTVKPTELMRYLIKLVTQPGGKVLDPFMGSGSTGKAALLDGYDFYGIEKDKHSFDIALQRIEKNKTHQTGFLDLL